MNCLKCGREIDDDQVFCPSCLEVMKEYPIKPGTAIHLPRRALDPVVRKMPKRRRVVSPEERVSRLQHTVRRLTAAVVILALGLTVSSFFLFRSIFMNPSSGAPGRNYTITSDKEP